MAKSEIERLRAAHATVAKLVALDPVYVPVFERLDAELSAQEASEDIIAKARAIAARQNAMA